MHSRCLVKILLNFYNPWLYRTYFIYNLGQNGRPKWSDLGWQHSPSLETTLEQ